MSSFCSLEAVKMNCFCFSTCLFSKGILSAVDLNNVLSKVMLSVTVSSFKLNHFMIPNSFVVLKTYL